MNFPFLIARRYLFAKKSHQAVNIISIVSVVGVAIGTIALVIIMSVFNGFEDLTRRLYSAFDPDLKITAAAGKFFAADTLLFQQLRADPDVMVFSQTVEENVMVKYGNQQEIAVMKGVDEHYRGIAKIDSMIYEGKFALWGGDLPQAAIGLTMAYKLRVGLNFITPLHFYAIRNTPQISFNPDRALSKKYLFPSGIFAVDEEVDSRYIIVPIEFARTLLENDTATSAIEVKIRPGADINRTQRRIAAIFGDRFDVKTSFQQKEMVYKILKSEKFIAFMILAFVLLIASFNVAGSLSMLMIEKKNDTFILQTMGVDKRMLARIFITQGWMIVMAGAFAGMLLATILCWLQMAFGLVRVPGSGTYIIDAYPVVLRLKDFPMILAAVAGVSLLTIYFPVKYFVRKYVIHI